MINTVTEASIRAELIAGANAAGGAFRTAPKGTPVDTITLQDLADQLGTDTETAAGFAGHITSWPITQRDADDIAAIWAAQPTEETR